ncbi:MAG: PAS domain S-box protein, partial [Myxococcota bacterium]|nr:PAS domain S-box protein [Myxococcota bacterium]
MGAHRTAAGGAVARVAVLQESSRGHHWAPPGRGAQAGPGPDGRPDTALALARLGGEAEILLAADVRQCAKLAGLRDTDLVLLDRCDRATVAAFFESSVPSGRSPVVVVISKDAPESAALDAFRWGAADCVRFGEDYSEVLTLVAMEQIRRWRHVREREATRSRIEWLENLNEAIVTEIPVALVVVSRNRQVVDVNPEFERTFGLSAAKTRGKPVSDVLPPDLIESGDLTQFFPPRSPGDCPGPRLARMADRDGEERVFDIRSQSLDGDGHILLAFSDVTETELLSRRVGELERFNEYVVQSINSALMVIDLSGRISYANPTAARILGHDEADLRGESVERFFGAPDGTASLVARALQEGVHSKGSELMLGLKGGRAIPIGISCTPLTDDQGGIRGAVAIFQDLTEIKELQRQVLQQEKMASIGQLAAGIAHEINNPVGFIHANLAQMAEYLGDLSGFLDQVGDLQHALSAG